MPEEMKSRPIPTIVSSVPCEGLLFAALVILMAEDPTNITKTYEEVARYTMSPWLYPETEEIMKDLAEAFYYDKNSRNHPGLLLEQLSEITILATVYGMQLQRLHTQEPQCTRTYSHFRTGLQNLLDLILFVPLFTAIPSTANAWVITASLHKYLHFISQIHIKCNPHHWKLHFKLSKYTVRMACQRVKHITLARLDILKLYIDLGQDD
ncbi:hypothetical protein SK128_016226 [Halocaridina rubra]|uniref:Uncharacterized protein n=1 Tax=Halocaridina rubra TaxID=373956 RepID=A0AAN9A738_HALRR